jgi:hypothetical protein
MESKKNKVYRIVESNFYERGEVRKDCTMYHVEVQKKFLWYSYWSSIKEPNYEHESIINFKTLEEAQNLIDKLKKDERINGWGRRVVGGDANFEKI